MQRQIKAFLHKNPSPYDEQALTAALMATDEATTTANIVMDNRQRYFLIKFLKQGQTQGRDSLDAVVLDVQGSEAQFYIESICLFGHCRKPPYPITPNQHVNVRVSQADPFQGILRFEMK